MKHLSQITLVAALSLAGEFLGWLIPLPIPGSIYGLVLLFVLLLLKVIRLPQIKEISDWLLSLMPIMFVGPTVALIVTFDEYRSFLIPLLLTATVTTVIVMAVSGCTAQKLIDRTERKEKNDAE